MDTDLCNKCGECCKNIMADIERKLLFRDGIEHLEEDFLNMLIPVRKKENITFFKCKYLKDNLCTNPDKPKSCMDYPSHDIAYLPDECGYTGLIFMKSEKLKQKIRKLKEDIIHYQAIISTSSSKDEINRMNKIINSHQNFINKYLPYGSEDW